MTCLICDEREDLRSGSYFRYGVKRDPAQHSILGHTEFAQTAWELGIYKEDNPEEWRELKRVTGRKV